MLKVKCFTLDGRGVLLDFFQFTYFSQNCLCILNVQIINSSHFCTIVYIVRMIVYNARFVIYINNNFLDADKHITLHFRQISDRICCQFASILLTISLLGNEIISWLDLVLQRNTSAERYLFLAYL